MKLSSDNPLMQLSEAFDSIGHPIYSDEYLGRVMAWACCSGFCEPCVTNPALNTVLMIAAKRFNIQGGCVPNMEKMDAHWRPAMQALINNGAATPWLAPMMERYRIEGWEKLNYREWASEFHMKPPAMLIQQKLFE